MLHCVGVISSVSEANNTINFLSRDSLNICYTKERFKYLLSNYDLSVIVPASNSEKWIKRALNSIMSQVTRYRFEMIVINDVSTDTLQHYRMIINLKI